MEPLNLILAIWGAALSTFLAVRTIVVANRIKVAGKLVEWNEIYTLQITNLSAKPVILEDYSLYRDKACSDNINLDDWGQCLITIGSNSAKSIEFEPMYSSYFQRSVTVYAKFYFKGRKRPVKVKVF